MDSQTHRHGIFLMQQNCMFALHAVMTGPLCLLTCVCEQRTKRGQRRPYLLLCVYTAKNGFSSVCVSYDVAAPLMKSTEHVYNCGAAAILSVPEDAVNVSVRSLHEHVECVLVFHSEACCAH